MFVRANKRDRDDIVRGMLFAVTVLAWMPALPAAAEMFGRGVQPCGDKLHSRIVECIKAKPNAADQRLNTPTRRCKPESTRLNINRCWRRNVCGSNTAMPIAASTECKTGQFGQVQAAECTLDDGRPGARTRKGD
jgi:hypothetical protein